MRRGVSRRRGNGEERALVSVFPAFCIFPLVSNVGTATEDEQAAPLRRAILAHHLHLAKLLTDDGLSGRGPNGARDKLYIR